MRKGLRSCFFALTLFIGLGLNAIEESKSEFRISALLPYLVHPPLVEPYLPSDFILGQREEDPSFSQGYYWGNSRTVQSYFENPSALNSCIIRAQVSTNVVQMGLDRFSNDGKINDLTAAGFTEITVNKGKWGIFPYREIHAKGPKGRHYYQLWVGLNETNGSTVYFQLLYPEYLNEPTQNQKKIWNDFIQKTAFLSLQDLMVFQTAETSKEKNKPFKISIEKRRLDHRFAVLVEAEEDLEINIYAIKEYNLLAGVFKRPYVELQIDVRDGENVQSDTLQIGYTPVDEFTFDSMLLYPTRLETYPNYFLLLKSS